MADFTLFELHFHDGFDFSPSSVVGGGDEDVAVDFDDSESEPEAVEGDGSSAPGRIAKLLVVAGLFAVLGLGVRKLMSDDLDPMEELEELDEKVEA